MDIVTAIGLGGSHTSQGSRAGRITGIAFACTGRTTSLASVVRKANRRCARSSLPVRMIPRWKLRRTVR